MKEKKLVALACLTLVLFGFALSSVVSASPNSYAINVIRGPTCTNPEMIVKNPDGSGYIPYLPVTISYSVTVYHFIGDLNGKPMYWTESHSTCYKLVVNSGLDQLSILDGNNATGGPVYLVMSTSSAAAAAADVVCGAATGAYILNGFSVANSLSTYTHSTGTNTYTLTHTWTYSGSSTVVLATACMQSHSSATVGTPATTALVDETLLSSTATVNTNGDKVQLTATVTV